MGRLPAGGGTGELSAKGSSGRQARHKSQIIYKDEVEEE